MKLILLLSIVLFVTLSNVNAQKQKDSVLYSASVFFIQSCIGDMHGHIFYCDSAGIRYIRDTMAYINSLNEKINKIIKDNRLQYDQLEKQRDYYKAAFEKIKGIALRLIDNLQKQNENKK